MQRITFSLIAIALIAAVLVASMYPLQAQAAIAFDTSTNTGDIVVNSSDFSYTAAATSVITVCVSTVAGVAHNSVAWGGNSFTQIGTTQSTGAGDNVSLWYYYTASGGTANIQATVNGDTGTTHGIVGAVSLSGVDATPLDGNAQESEFGSGSSLNVTVGTADSWLVSCVLHSWGSDGSFTSSSGQTVVNNVDDGANIDFAMGYEGPVSAGTEASNWSHGLSNQFTGQVVGAFAAAAGGGDPPVASGPDVGIIWFHED